jgi:hypothetical protein
VGEDVRVAPFTGHFLRYEGTVIPERLPFGVWRRQPESWFELYPEEPLLASSMEEARELIKPHREALEEVEYCEGYARRPYLPPAVPEKVQVIHHPTRIAEAIIARHTDGRFEVFYKVYAPNGRYFPVSTPSISSEMDWEWGVTWPKDESGKDLQTFADSLESAEAIAVRELSQLVDADPEIKLREQSE